MADQESTAHDTETLATLVAGEALQPNASPALRWLADALAEAEMRTLTSADLARIDAYVGGAKELHQLLPAVLPLPRAVWYATSITAQHGTAIDMGYVAVPADGGIDVGYVALSRAHRSLIGPIGPVRVTATSMTRPVAMDDGAWREVRSATGIIIRALLIGV